MRVVYNHLRVPCHLVRVDQIITVEVRRVHFFERLHILRPDAGHKHSADIAEHCVLDLGVIVLYELADVLMRNRETKPVLARLGQNGCDRIRDEILKLVNVQIKIFALAFRHIGAGKRGHLQFGNDDEPEKIRVHLAGLAL